MHKYILISIFTLLFFTAVNGQQKDDDSTTVTTNDNNTQETAKDILYVDTTLYYKQPYFSPDSAKSWKEWKDFAYVKNLDSLLKDAKDKQNKQVKKDTGSSGSNWLWGIFSAEGTKFFFWGLAAFFVLFILYRLFLTEGVFKRRSAVVNFATPEAIEETITSESDFEIMIRQAVQSGNFRLAVRYQYLQTLYKLAAKKMVELAVDKTNNQYVREITNLNYQNDFAALTLNYEYVWYGEFAIDENIYRRLESGFLQFNSKL